MEYLHVCEHEILYELGAPIIFNCCIARDVLHGGTWLGIHSSSTRAAFLTNIREEPLEAFQNSRGVSSEILL